MKIMYHMYHFKKCAALLDTWVHKFRIVLADYAICKILTPANIATFDVMIFLHFYVL